MPCPSYKTCQEPDPQKRVQKILKCIQSDRDRQLRCLKNAAKTYCPTSMSKNCCCIEKHEPSTFLRCPSSPGCPAKTKGTRCKKYFFSKPICLQRILKDEKAKKSKQACAIRRRVRRQRETRNMCCRCIICGAAIGVIAVFALYWIPIYAAVVAAL